MSYWAYQVPESVRDWLADHYPFKFGEHRGDHITVCLGDAFPEGWPVMAAIEVCGYGCDNGIEAFRVTVNGRLEQPRGIPLHITWSFDPLTAQAKDSSRLEFKKIENWVAEDPVRFGARLMHYSPEKDSDE